MVTREGYFDLNSTMGEIMKTFRGKLVLLAFAGIIMSSMKKNSKSDKPKGMGGGMKMKLDSNVMKMLDGFTVLRASNMLGMVGASVTKKQLLALNTQLNGIKKPVQK